MQFNHTAVMLKESLYYLNCAPDKIYLDCTIGGGGHSKEILNAGGFLVGIDQDIEAIRNSEIIFESYKNNLNLIHNNFADIVNILKNLNIKGIDGIILDLGMSLHQIQNSKRGFSFMRDEPLDMRMNISEKITAKDIVNKSSEEELVIIFKNYGEERFAKRIAERIVNERVKEPILSSLRLSQIVIKAVPKSNHFNKIHPATKVFMALRIMVNKELERLNIFMKNVCDIMNPNARLCVISFHSLEDRIVKQTMKALEKGCICPSIFPQCVCKKKSKFRILTRHALKPTDNEIVLNPMARSARLRVAEKITS